MLARCRAAIASRLFAQGCRKEWAEQALRQDSGFDVNVAALAINHEFLNRARDLYDMESETRPKGPEAKSESRSWGQDNQRPQAKGSEFALARPRPNLNPIASCRP